MIHTYVRTYCCCIHSQDRAHRIGQTREVHIYRLVTSSSIEENILKKAQQKRHLDFLGEQSKAEQKRKGKQSKA